MNYPYPTFFLDVRLAKRRLEKELAPASGELDGFLDEPCWAKLNDTWSSPTKTSSTKQEPALSIHKLKSAYPCPCPGACF